MPKLLPRFLLGGLELEDNFYKLLFNFAGLTSAAATREIKATSLKTGAPE